MNGPEHYRRAEALLKSCQIDREDVVEFYPAQEDGVDSTAHALAAAQIHATLALAAATANSYPDGEGWANAYASS